jgi:hypothetical protein
LRWLPAFRHHCFFRRDGLITGIACVRTPRYNGDREKLIVPQQEFGDKDMRDTVIAAVQAR